MDNHTGPTHDMPDYVPNWPVPVKVKAKVYQRNGFWFWSHVCPTKKLTAALGYPKLTHEAAFEAALKHARGCW